MDTRSRPERRSVDHRRAQPELAPEPRAVHDAVLQLQRGAGNRAVTALLAQWSPGVARIDRTIERNGKQIAKPSAIGQLNTAAKGFGLNLTFNEFEAKVEEIRVEMGKVYELTKITVEEIVAIYSRVSGRTDLTVENAPRIEKVEKTEKKKEAPVEQAPEKSPKEKADEAIRELIRQSDDSRYKFRYRWGGTSKLEESLRVANPGKRVEKRAEDDGTRVLTVEDVTYGEEPSAFPLSVNQPYEEEEFNAVTAACEQFGIKHPAAWRFIGDLFRMSLAKKIPLAATKRKVNAFLLLFKEELADETEFSGGKVTLESVLASASSAEIYEEMVRGPENKVVEALKAIAGVEPISGNEPGLILLAEKLISAGILASPTWKAARTEEEFAGTVGEYLTHQQIWQVMPGDPAKLEQGDAVVQLHSVHFIGDRYKTGESAPTHTNTDACAELDLMTTIRRASGAFECLAIGNTKVSSTSRAGEADKQNKDAVAAMRSFVGAKREPLPSDSKKLVEILVTKIEGLGVGTNEPIALKTLTLADGLEQRKIGAQGASGEYTHAIAQNYRQVHTIALILRGRMKKKVS